MSVAVDLKVIEAKKFETELLVIPVFQNEDKKPLLAELPDLPEKTLKKFKAKRGETRLLFEGDFKAERLMLLGAGKIDEIKLPDLTELGGMLFKEVDKLELENCAFVFPMQLSMDREKVARELVTGLKLAAYRFKRYKNEDEEKDEQKVDIGNVDFLIDDGRSKSTVSRGLCVGEKLAAAVIFARDLGNTPGNELTPSVLAEEAEKLAGENSAISVHVWDEKKLKREGMNLIMAVGRGSKNPPRFIELVYEPEKTKATVALVGKGVTFDSGGISIKPGKNMGEMKYDMSGAGTVLALVKAVSELELPLKLIALIPCAENMPGGNSTRPGDIVTGYSGKSVEILNTDAEGRLILADALGYLSKNYAGEVDLAVDYATLTGACVVALGHAAAAVISNNEQLAEQFKTVGMEIGEPAWPLPSWKEYSKKLESKIADVKNIGGRAGTITAACFLKEFVDTDKIENWAHLDIAGVAYGMEELSYRPESASGYGVRLTVELLEERFNL
ncbi:MAG: leucyl aminopeptidase [bacterium]